MRTTDISGPGNPDFMECFRKGDKEAHRWVFDAVGGDLEAFVVGIVKDRVVAENIVSECFYRLYYQRGDFSELAEIRRWLFLVGRQECIAYLNGG